MTGRPLVREEIDAMNAARAAGLTLAEIAQRFGRSPTTISTYVTTKRARPNPAALAQIGAELDALHDEARPAPHARFARPDWFDEPIEKLARARRAV